MKTIPKIIHYVWVGNNPKPETVLECIESWHKHLPDWQIIEWNEERFDISSNRQVKLAIDTGNYAYAADIIRIYALKEYGGVYLDTDVLLIKPLDSLLVNTLFLGYESKYWFGTAVIGSVKNHPVLNLIWQRYTGSHQLKFSTNPLTVHAFASAIRFLYKYKLNGKTTEFNNMLFLSEEYFYPINYMSLKENITENTIAIHYYAGTWHTSSHQRSFSFARFFRKILGKKIFSFFEWIVSRRFNRILIKEFKKIRRK